MPMSDELTEVSIPNFLVKVWNIVEDSNYDNCIHWDDSGFSFHVADPFTFSKDVLPLYFKHNNLSSFVRQLNMYGFRKVTPLERSGLSRAQSDQEHLEFQHAYFVRGHPELLQHIKRKSTTTTSSNTGTGKAGGNAGENRKSTPAMTQKGMDKILDEVHSLREKQKSWDATLTSLQKENETLWREVAAMRNLHTKQQTIVNKLIQFLLSVVQPSTASGKRLGKRQLLAIEPEDLMVGTDAPGPSGEKRLRYDSTGAVVPQLANSAGASSTLRALQQELRRASSNSTPTNTGPIIADVTDELSESSPLDQRSPSPTPSSGQKPPANEMNSIYLSALAHALSGAFDPQGINGFVGQGNGEVPMRAGSNRSMADRSSNLTSPQEFTFTQPQPEQTLNQNALATFDPNSEVNAAGMNTRPATATNEAQMGQTPALDLNYPTPTGPPQIDRFGSAVPKNPQHSFRTRTTSQDFSDFLEFMDSDLESLRDTINSNSQLSVNSDFLSTLFDSDNNPINNSVPDPQPQQQHQPALTQARDPLLTAVTSADGGSIRGNELTLYQAPNILSTPNQQQPPPTTVQAPLETSTDDLFGLLNPENSDTNLDAYPSLETPISSPSHNASSKRRLAPTPANKGGKLNQAPNRMETTPADTSASLNYQGAPSLIQGQAQQATRQNSSIPQAGVVIRRSPSYSKMSGGPGSKGRRK